ncbi:MAG: PHB depolymerase family esterase, partial [Pseudomonadota bacterium]|nr:PHB depolymerase family esterase [Pseudomonadota bacterium]
MSNFLRKLFATTGLTRRGHLTQATRAIQQALARQATIVERRPFAPVVATATPASTGRFAASSFTSASGTRSFKLFEPAGFEGQMLPLVVLLHGCTQSPDDFAAGTRMNALAQERGLFVLYPEQSPRSNANKCWNWFVPGD